MRRWLRRQDRLTRGLLLAAALLATLVVVLHLPRPKGARREHRPVVAAPPASKAPAVGTRRTPRSGSGPDRPRTAGPAPAPATPKPPPAVPRAASPARADHPVVPRVAIVIDDLGQNLSHLEQLADLGITLTVAVIPGLPATARTVGEASRRGIELLLHQPMEPREEGGKNPGEGVLLTSMTAQDLRARLRESLAAVPGAVGVNNHMGSRFTEDPAGVGALMAVLRDRNLFWLDSRTTAATRGPEAARTLGVPAIERDIFIDAEVNADFIRGQLRKLVETARMRGAAVGIGHPHAETLAVLREMREELLGAGVALVPVSALVRSAPTAAEGRALVSSIPSAQRRGGTVRGGGAAATP